MISPPGIFAGPLDLAGENELRQANASPALLDALKTGNNAASQEQLAQARKRIADAKAAEQRAAEQKAAVAAQWAVMTLEAANKIIKQ